MADTDLWSASTDEFIGDLDPVIEGKYGFKLRDFLTNPEDYATRTGIADTINSIREDVKEYFDNLLNGMQGEQAKLSEQLENAQSIYEKIGDMLSKKGSDVKFPVIKPVSIDRNTDFDENIIIEKYDDSIENLVSKLVGSSNYVADLSIPYKSYFFGSWLFSGSKNYLLSVNIPDSPVIDVDTATAEIGARLDYADSLVAGKA